MSKEKVIVYKMKQPMATIYALGMNSIMKTTMIPDLDAIYQIFTDGSIDVETKKYYQKYEHALRQKGVNKLSDLKYGNLAKFKIISAKEKTDHRGKFFVCIIKILS